MNTKKPVVLIILDGWGHSEQSQHNPIHSTQTPTLDKLWQQNPHTLIEAAGEAVGLPKGQMGNSEVGHLHIGAGRKIPQDLTRIRRDIESGAFKQRPIILAAIQKAKQQNSAIHIIGLVSPGGVHSHENQIAALIEAIGAQGVTKNYLHAILDGRDTPPKSAAASLQRFEQLYQQQPGGSIATVTGRYYAMDRDKRWPRTQQAYDLLTAGISNYKATTATEALQQAYARQETDEFVKPTAIINKQQQPITINDQDIVIFMNFRADRARQLSHALTDHQFTYFERKKQPKINELLTLTNYGDNIEATIIYPQLTVNNCLGEFLAKQNLTQLRLAETEKYAHVTYFLNGGAEQPFPHEQRVMIPSPKVATYDLQPQMSAIELTDQLTQAIEQQQFDVIICNYANPDMVGHTGIESAAEQAVTTIDQCLKRVTDSLQTVGGELLLTADHGNIETMYDEQTQQPHTAHTSHLVPLLYIGRQAQFKPITGALDDVAPTLLYILGLQPPTEMTGRNLLTFS